MRRVWAMTINGTTMLTDPAMKSENTSIKTANAESPMVCRMIFPPPCILERMVLPMVSQRYMAPPAAKIDHSSGYISQVKILMNTLTTDTKWPQTR